MTESKRTGRLIIPRPTLCLLILLPVVSGVAAFVLFSTAEREEEQAEKTLADPPSGAAKNPHAITALGSITIAPRLAGAERLYRLGMEASEGGTSDGFMHFMECTAFHSKFARCHRELGVTAAYRNHNQLAITSLREYLRLEPEALDSEEVQDLISRLEKGRVDRPTPIRLRTNEWKDPELEFGGPPATPGPDTSTKAARLTRKAIDAARRLRLSEKQSEAVRHLERFMESVPQSVGEELQAELWCALGIAYDSVQEWYRGLQAYTVGIEQHPFSADCHYFACVNLDVGAEAREACGRYLSTAPEGRFAEDARRRASAETSAAKGGDVVIRSLPPGAAVYLDDSMRGLTPVTLRDLPPGVHQIRISLAGYRSETMTVELESSRVKKTVMFELRPVGE